MRKLLAEITKREKQAGAAQARRGGGGGRKVAEPNGRLAPADVEREIAGSAAAGVAGGGGNGGGSSALVVGSGSGSGRENVYLKATGRAIPRALELGVRFQGEGGCWVRVEMGSVCAVDDVEVSSSSGQGGGVGDEQEGDGDEEIPETRIRTLSSVTVIIGLK